MPSSCGGAGTGLDGVTAAHLVTNTVSVLERGQAACEEPDTRYLLLIGKTGLIYLLINRQMCVGKEKESGRIRPSLSPHHSARDHCSAVLVPTPCPQGAGEDEDEEGFVLQLWIP